MYVLTCSVSVSNGIPFAFITNKTIINQPANVHSRWRFNDYKSRDTYFFQWWNFLVYDSLTHNHWTLVYHTSKYSSNAGLEDYGSVSMIHRTGPQHQTWANDKVPLTSVHHSNDWDLDYTKQEEGVKVVPYRMYVIDDDTYRIEAKFDKQYTCRSVSVSW